MANFDKTMSFKVERDANIKVKEILKEVYDALVEKGYNPNCRIYTIWRSNLYYKL